MDTWYDTSTDSFISKEIRDGQIYTMEFNLDDADVGVLHVNIAFYVLSKRKDFEKVMCENGVYQTGKNGFVTYSIARQQFKELYNELIDYFKRHKIDKIILYTRWLDNRRRNVYEKFLSRYGFTYGRLDNKKVLMKVITNDDLQYYDI